MKQVLVTIAVLFSCYLSVSAQKEVYFDTIKTENIKVTSLKGIEISLNVEPFTLINNILNVNTKEISIPLHIEFFNEKRILPTWTLITRIGLVNTLSSYYNFIPIHDSIDNSYTYDPTNFRKIYSYSLAINLGIEPRWYWGYKNRVQMGKANLNSGWFLALPVSLQMPLPIYLHTAMQVTPTYTVINKWIKDYFNVYGSVSPTVGFRQAISNRWILEGSAGLKVSSGFYDYSNYVGLMQPTINPELSIKAAYTLK